MSEQLGASSRDVEPTEPTATSTARFPGAPPTRVATDPIVVSSARSPVGPPSGPRRRSPGVITGAVLAGALVVLGAGTWVAQRPAPLPAAAGSAVPVGLSRTGPGSSAAAGTPGAARDAPIRIDIDIAEATGVLAVPAHRWTTVGTAAGSSRLMVQVSLTGRSGAMSYDPSLLKVFDDRGRLYDNALPPGSSGELGSGMLGPGDTATGWVGFDVPRGGITLVLGGWRGESIAAVRIPA
ncbi:MAG: hypothetical protein ACR2LI_07150 [Propionibacteriaceae bacterium]